LGPPGESTRTYIPIKGKWHYLYRAVYKHGKTIDFRLRPDRGIAAAQAFFRKALATQAPRVPRKVTLDGHVPSHRALWLLRRADPCWRNVKVRSCKYLNNIIGAPGKVWRFQRVKIPHRQGASHPTGNRALGLWR
jgi:IS6 family transposase